MMKLYFGKGSCALASHLALEEAGASYEAIAVDLSSGEQHQPAYQAVNTKKRVPSLITDQGTLTETPAILVYIAQMFPDKQLASLDEPFSFARLQAFNSYLCSTVHVSHAHAARGGRWTDDPAVVEALKIKVPETMAASFKLINDEMLVGPWVMGDQYTVCDPYLFTLTRWLERDGVDVKSFPKVAAHFEAMGERPATRAVLPQHSR